MQSIVFITILIFIFSFNLFLAGISSYLSVLQHFAGVAAEFWELLK